MGVPNYLVEPYAVLSAPIAFQRFESVARRNLQVTEDGTSLELPQLSQPHIFQRGEATNALSKCQSRRVTTLETSDQVFRRKSGTLITSSVITLLNACPGSFGS